MSNLTPGARLAALAPQPEPRPVRSRNGSATVGRGDYRTLDIVALYQAHGLYGRDLGGGKHAVKCPNAAQHSDNRGAEASDTVIYEGGGGGMPGQHCLHSHCGHLKDLFELLKCFPDADRFCSAVFLPERPSTGRAERIPPPSEAPPESGLPADLWDDDAPTPTPARQTEPEPALETLPHAPEAEAALVGGLLSGAPAGVVREVLELVTPVDCYTPAHGDVLSVVRDLTESRQPVDVVTVSERLRVTGLLELLGGLPGLARLQKQAVPGGNLVAYAQRVKEQGQLRDLIDICRAMERHCREPQAVAESVREDFVRMMLSVAGNRHTEAISYAEAVELELQRIHDLRDDPTLMFGLHAVDRIAEGLGRGQVGLVCGRPGMGKTVWCAQQMRHAAETWGSICYVSLEMRAQDLVRRELAALTRYTFHELRRSCRRDEFSGEYRPFSRQDLAHLDEAREPLLNHANRIWIDDQTCTLSRLVSRVHRYRLRFDLQALIVDYGQLVRDDSAGKSVGKAEEVMRVARALKNDIAMPLDIPVLVAVQANRESERGQDGQKMLSFKDLGWSSEWEAVASLILFLNGNPERKALDLPTKRHVLVDIHKNRNGAQGLVPLVLDAPRFRFGADTDREENE